MTDAGALWGGATYERIAETFAAIHDRVAAELGPVPGARALDVACGTGALALRLAGLGAETTGLDISPAQLDKARAAAAEAGLEIRFDVGDAEALPYGDGVFDALGSTFGVVFAPDVERAAAELARVTKPGGRIAVTSWTDDDWAALNRRVGRPEAAGDEYRWSREAETHALLGDAFELRRETGEWRVAMRSPEALWELMSTSAPPLKAWLEELDAVRVAEVEREFLDFFAGRGLRREYVLILGTRR